MRWILDQFENKDIVFVGLGKGRAAEGVETFLRQNCNILSFTGVDKQEVENPWDFLKSYDKTRTVFIKNEGVPGSEVPVPYVTQLQIFFRLISQTRAITVGVTGTKGKSTTTSLTAHILKTAGKNVVLAGNIGVSPLLSLDQANESTIFVLELSSYQLSDIGQSPHIGAVINLYNDHSDWHGSIENYWDAKRNIVRYASFDDVFIFNPDFPKLQEWADASSCKKRPINPAESYDFESAKLFGDHNRLNVLIAREIARELGVTDDITHKAVLSFEPLEHRMEFVANKMNRVYINDAIGMTPESTTASFRAITAKYGSVGCLLLGGQDRNYDFSGLLDEIANAQVPSLVLFPDTVDKMRASLPAGYNPDIFETTSMAEAVKFATEHSPEESVILLSTAAPSYSLWKDFEEKGAQFKQAVANL